MHVPWLGAHSRVYASKLGLLCVHAAALIHPPAYALVGSVYASKLGFTVFSYCSRTAITSRPRSTMSLFNLQAASSHAHSTSLGLKSSLYACGQFIRTSQISCGECCLEGRENSSRWWWASLALVSNCKRCCFLHSDGCNRTTVVLCICQ